MNIVKELLIIAKSDLKSSVLLFEAGQFNKAIFQLQQSIEKLVKSYGIATEVIEEKDLQKKVNHLPHKVFARLFKIKIDDLEQFNEPILAQEMIPPNQEKSDNIEIINSLKNTHLKVSHLKLENMEKIDSQEIEKFLSGIEAIEKFEYDENVMFEKIKFNLIQTQKHFKSYFTNSLKIDNDSPVLKAIEVILKNPDEFAQIELNNHKYTQIVQININYIVYVWLNLSIITSPHEQATRYPSSDTGKSPNDYNESHVLIKYYPRFIPLIEKSIILYEELFANDEIKASL